MPNTNGTALPAPLPEHWGYVALVPGTKRPAVNGWQNTPMRRDDTDPRARGIHLGASGLIEVDDDGGLDAWLKSTGHVLPETFTVRTASGRLKRFYAAPAGVALTHASRAIPGVELRCGNHQAVAPGSVVDGVAYYLADGRAPSAPPEWVTTAMTSSSPRPDRVDAPRRVPLSVAAREFDRAVRGLAESIRSWAATGWGEQAHAGLLAATMHLARLNAEQAESAYLWAFRAAGAEPDDADMAKLYSAIDRAVPDIVIPDDQLSPQERFFLGGDSPLGPGQSLDVLAGVVGLSGAMTTADEGLFEPISRSRFRNRKPPPPAVYGAFGGAVPTFYAEGVHWLQGESESGKTWVGCAIVADVLRQGGTALYVDYEDTIDRVLERLDQLGVTDDEIERLVYVDGTSAGFHTLVAHVAVTIYSAMVVDGVTSSLTSAGLKGRDEQELTRWCDLLPRQAQMSICIDHVVKSKDDRGGMAIGSQAKKSVVTGSSFEVVCEKKFGRGKEGLIVLNLQKDKPGGIRGASVRTVRLKFLSDPATGSVVLCVPSAAPTADGGAAFFSEGPEVRINALVALLQHHEATGQTWRPSVEATVRVLRKELGQEGDDRNILRPAARKYLAAKGYSAYSSDVA